MAKHQPIAWAISDGLTDYREAERAMVTRAHAIRDGAAREMIWLVEHPPLYTAGTSAKAEHLLAPQALPVFETGRGGQYTYHGPGQRVVYVMLDLASRGGDVRALIYQLERWIIATLDTFNVAGETRPGRVGIWVKRPYAADSHDEKIAAIGLRVTRGVTFHGLSLNVEPDLSHYRGIVPCGLAEHGVTSLTDLGLPVTMADCDVALRSSFESVFGATVAAHAPQPAEHHAEK
jgi:lipoyl(octanoyl) transferase